MYKTESIDLTFINSLLFNDSVNLVSKNTTGETDELSDRFNF
jgi:hypothetical protein